MTDTTNEITPVDEAEELVRSARDVRDRWTARRADLARELQELDDNIGALLLEDPSQEDTLVDRTVRLRHRVSAAEKALDAQEPIVLAAELAYLQAVADAEQVRVDAAAAAVAKHRAVVAVLLTKLEELDGQSYVSAYEFAAAQSAAGVLVEGAIRYPKSHLLAEEATVARRRSEALRALAAGQALQPLLSSWGMSAAQVLPPTVYGATAVVAAPEWLASVERAKASLAELEELASRLPDEIAKQEVLVAAAMQRDAAPQPGLEQRMRRSKTIGGELAHARSVVAAMEA